MTWRRAPGICGACRRGIDECVASPCVERQADSETEALIDAYHRGWDAHRRGDDRPNEPSEAMGWDARRATDLVIVVLPDRPEGYYHVDPREEA